MDSDDPCNQRVNISLAGLLEQEDASRASARAEFVKKSGLEPHERIIVALDVSNPERAMLLAHRLRSHVGLFKVGLEYMHSLIRLLLTGSDNELARQVLIARSLHAEIGSKLFYDAKLHDIPQTVQRAMAQIALLGAKMTNLHCAGGAPMMKAAVQGSVDALGSSGDNALPLILGVTLLTSLSYEDLVDVGFADKLNIADREERAIIEQNRIEGVAVRKLAWLAQESGLDGIICSPKELPSVRKYCQPDFLAVTPGIRPPGSPKDDQKRTLTPYEAIMEGADYLVIGRPIAKAPDPVEATKHIADDIGRALEKRGK